MNIRMQIICAWAGPAFVALLTPVWLYMGFLPVPSPTMTPEEVAAMYDERRLAIRFGATAIMQLTMLGVLWTAAISAQLRRIESGDTPVLTYANLAFGAIGYFLFIIPAQFWTAAAFRPERDIDIIYALNDYSWLSLLMPVASAVLQALVIGVAIMSDKRAQPVYPRWAAYMNFWCAVVFMPGALATFFKTGPFAWNGIFDFYIPLFAFTVWIVVMAWLTVRAAKQQAREEAGA